jgi:hypothetical protein
VNRCGAGLELHARDGRAVLVGSGHPPRDPGELRLPADLAAALHEWARVAEAVRQAGDCGREPGALVSQRGRLLAARLAGSTGVPVGYADPMASGVEVFPPAAEREPTPWATGLTISAVTAVLVGVALTALSQTAASVGMWLAVLANVLAAAGLAPSMWLLRATPLWRWVAYGAAAGFVLTWTGLLLSLLGT